MIKHSIPFLNNIKKSKQYLLYNIFSILIFAFLYWLNDYFIYFAIENFPDIFNKYIDYSEYTGKINTFLYYLWFSLITQTTVGYSGLINANGKIIPFSKYPLWTFKYLNIMQLLSIFIIPILVVLKY